MVTDEGLLKQLAGLTNLEEPADLSGTSSNGQGHRGLSRKMTFGMKSLNLLGARATDASMEVLAGMPHLQVANLYRTGVTNSGLARLQGLKKELTDLDLRYSRVTANGVESLRAAIPNLKVQFVGSAAIGPKTAWSRPACGLQRAGDRRLGEGDGRQDCIRPEIDCNPSDLSSTPVSDAQLSYLSDLTKSRKTGSSASTQVGDLGLDALRNLKGLKQLDLESDHRFQDAGLAKLSPNWTA